MIKAKKIGITFVLGVPKEHIRKDKTKLLDFLYGCMRNKKFGKEKIYRYGLPEDFLSKGQTPINGGVH